MEVGLNNNETAYMYAFRIPCFISQTHTLTHNFKTSKPLHPVWMWGVIMDLFENLVNLRNSVECGIPIACLVHGASQTNV